MGGSSFLLSIDRVYPQRRPVPVSRFPGVVRKAGSCRCHYFYLPRGGLPDNFVGFRGGARPSQHPVILGRKINFRNKIGPPSSRWYIRIVSASTPVSPVAACAHQESAFPSTALSGSSVSYRVLAGRWPRNDMISPDGGEGTKSRASTAEMGLGVRTAS